MITHLTTDSVSILTEVDGINHRIAYSNSAAGRTALQTEQVPETVAEVLEVWGETPTIPEEPPEPEIPQPPSLEERLAALEAVQLEMILGGAL